MSWSGAPTTHLGINTPQGTDPFSHSDFDTYIQTMDQYPGVFVCTSTTHPSWGTGQQGMLICEQDTGRLMRWNGTAFVPPVLGGLGGARSLANQPLVASTTGTQNFYLSSGGGSGGAIVLPNRSGLYLQATLSCILASTSSTDVAGTASFYYTYDHPTITTLHQIGSTNAFEAGDGLNPPYYGVTFTGVSSTPLTPGATIYLVIQLGPHSAKLDLYDTQASFSLIETPL